MSAIWDAFQRDGTANATAGGNTLLQNCRAQWSILFVLGSRESGNHLASAHRISHSMMQTIRRSLISGMLLFGGCASLPSGPSVLVLPGTGKNFDQFRADDADCRQYAIMQTAGNTPGQTANDSVARSAVLGTVVGAAAGAAMGGQNSASIGAGTGLAVGALAGADAGDASAYDLQRRYDYAFMQCMYAKGHKIPVSGRFESSRPSATAPPPPAPPASVPR
jgi:hypothetical protein